MLIVVDKSTHEEHLFHFLQTNNKQFKLAVSLLSDYNDIFKVTNKNLKIYYTVSIKNDDFNQITILPEAYEIGSLNNEIKRFFIEEGFFTEADYAFIIKPNFSTLGCFIELSNITDSGSFSAPLIVYEN